MPATQQETHAAVLAMRKRLNQAATSIGNLPTIPTYLAPAIERIITVALHDAEQQVRHALDPAHAIEPWAPLTPEEIAAQKAQPVEVVDEDGVSEIRRTLGIHK